MHTLTHLLNNNSWYKCKHMKEKKEKKKKTCFFYLFIRKMYVISTQFLPIVKKIYNLCTITTNF